MRGCTQQVIAPARFTDITAITLCDSLYMYPYLGDPWDMLCPTTLLQRRGFQQKWQLNVRYFM